VIAAAAAAAALQLFYDDIGLAATFVGPFSSPRVCGLLYWWVMYNQVAAVAAAASVTNIRNFYRSKRMVFPLAD
jgi:hypothetical protein